MKTLFYNPTTKVIFASEDQQDASIQTISADAVPDLIANGATVDPSADSLLSPVDAGNGAPGAAAPAASATGSATAEQGNVVGGVSPGTSATGTPAQDANAGASAGTEATVGTLAVPPVTPSGDPVPAAQPTAVSVEGHETAELNEGATGDYDGADHSTLLGRLLADLEGAVHMGKSEIISLIDKARAAFEG